MGLAFDKGTIKLKIKRGLSLGQWDNKMLGQNFENHWKSKHNVRANLRVKIKNKITHNTERKESKWKPRAKPRRLRWDAAYERFSLARCFPNELFSGTLLPKLLKRTLKLNTMKCLPEWTCWSWRLHVLHVLNNE